MPSDKCRDLVEALDGVLQFLRLKWHTDVDGQWDGAHLPVAKAQDILSAHKAHDQVEEARDLTTRNAYCEMSCCREQAGKPNGG